MPWHHPRLKTQLECTHFRSNQESETVHPPALHERWQNLGSVPGQDALDLDCDLEALYLVRQPRMEFETLQLAEGQTRFNDWLSCKRDTTDKQLHKQDSM